MSRLEINLFGRLDVRYDQQTLAGVNTAKVQQLLCYILLYRTRPHSRDALAELLWKEQDPGQSKKYLRKALWQLQAAFAPPNDAMGIPLLHIDNEWIQFNRQASCWLDIEEFERTFDQYEDMAGDMVQAEDAAKIQRAVQLYRGDLLDGWYQDWSLYERERFQYMYLALLDKLISFCEMQHEFEAAIGYGNRILRIEPAHEHTHRRLMYLYFLTGNRTAALRQYEHCVAALDKELDVQPSQQTIKLYNHIRHDEFELLADKTTPDAMLGEVYRRLKRLESILADAQRQVARELQLIRAIVRDPS